MKQTPLGPITINALGLEFIDFYDAEEYPARLVKSLGRLKLRPVGEDNGFISVDQPLARKLIAVLEMWLQTGQLAEESTNATPE